MFYSIIPENPPKVKVAIHLPYNQKGMFLEFVILHYTKITM